MAGKLTKAQTRVLASCASGALTYNYDVWAGYWWEENGQQMPSYHKSPNFPPLPVRGLLGAGLIERGDISHPFSGRHVATYYITDAGRAALKHMEN